MRLPLFIARRLYGGSRSSSQVSRPAVTVAVAGLAVGLAVMIVSICVVLGFKREIREKIFALAGHMEIVSRDRTRSLESGPIAVSDSVMEMVSSLPHVSHVQPYIIKSAVLKTDSAFTGIALKGVGSSYDMDFVRDHLLEGTCPEFSDSIQQGRIVISSAIAKRLSLKLGDRVMTYFVGSSIRLRKLEIAGIYSTHLEEFDSSIAYADIALARKLSGFSPVQATGIEIALDDYRYAGGIYERLAPTIDKVDSPEAGALHLQTAQMAYPALFAWLSLLDMNVWVILALMMLVSGFMMVSGLLIIILERASLIGVLKSMGAENGTIRRVFLDLALMFLSRGIVIGNLVGIGLCVVQKWLHVISLDPQTYYVDYVPMDIDLPALVILNIATLAATILVLVLPSQLVSHIDPSRSIRFE